MHTHAVFADVPSCTIAPYYVSLYYTIYCSVVKPYDQMSDFKDMTIDC